MSSGRDWARINLGNVSSATSATSVDVSKYDTRGAVVYFLVTGSTGGGGVKIETSSISTGGPYSDVRGLDGAEIAEQTDNSHIILGGQYNSIRLTATAGWDVTVAAILQVPGVVPAMPDIF